MSFILGRSLTQVAVVSKKQAGPGRYFPSPAEETVVDSKLDKF
jgi:hypothetical protein